MTYYLAVAVGGALGAVSRYWLMTAVTTLRFPWGTLAVNLLGSMLIGIGFVLLAERGNLNEVWRGLLIVGFLGALTTFSTFSLDALQLLLDGRVLHGMLYIAGSVVLCILLTWTGIVLARSLF